MSEVHSLNAELLKCVAFLGEFVQAVAEHSIAVVLIPATGLIAEQWWSVWGAVNAAELRPSILVYALQSDFGLWASMLDSGGYDVIVAPFTSEKLRRAIEAATAEFRGRT